MSIEFNCATCGKPFKVDDQWAGKRAKCKGCGNVITIPGPETVAPVESRPTPPPLPPPPLPPPLPVAAWPVDQGVTASPPRYMPPPRCPARLTGSNRAGLKTSHIVILGVVVACVLAVGLGVYQFARFGAICRRLQAQRRP